jgi:hypothetical protein
MMKFTRNFFSNPLNSHFTRSLAEAEKFYIIIATPSRRRRQLWQREGKSFRLLLFIDGGEFSA